ncbi:AlpA family transcriptional regulator, partial [Subdoligranulum variabile]|uniref:helix-turn-helix transcriptional regulator n=1 Tax=Subdoligranulum variabile TaxID=214851 RepID=UPI0026EDE8AC
MDGMEELLERIADVVAEKVVERLQGTKETYTVTDLAERYGKSRSTIHRLMAEGAFGQTIQVGERSRVVTAEGLRHFEQTRTGGRQREKAAAPMHRRKRADPGPI